MEALGFPIVVNTDNVQNEKNGDPLFATSLLLLDN